MSVKVSKELITEDVRRLYNEIGSIPTVSQYADKGLFGLNTAKRRFGSWNNLLNGVFGKIHKHYKINRIETKCGNPVCGVVVRVREGDSKIRFCSISCANRARPHRQRKERSPAICVRCGGEAQHRRMFCNPCMEKSAVEKRTLGSFRAKRGDANCYSQIREHARRIGGDIPNRCHVCGYDKHVQMCHRREIGSFGDTDTVKEVNALPNLVKLCPNHHWEFDHGLLVL